jgi:hypothetical protein
MSKKYLSLEETAAALRMKTDEVIRLREKGGLRGFADRGTWKFREDDVQQVARSRQPDSDPDVPILVPDDDLGEEPTIISPKDLLKSSDSEVKLVGGLAGESNIQSLGPMDSDSDVKLVGEPSKQALSDSDVKLAGDSSAASMGSDIRMVEKVSGSDVRPFVLEPESGLNLGKPAKKPAVDLGQLDSDSDVALVGKAKLDSDSDVALVGGKTDQISLGPIGGMGSDSDVRLVADPPKKSGSDSDVKLVESKKKDKGSDSDVALLSDDDQSIALDFTPDEGDSASVLSDESGIKLTGDSSGMLLKSESSIKLKKGTQESDEGITLDISSGSGISLEGAADSGISLESVADSGISLEGDRFSGTMPMMNAVREKDDETAFEIPAVKDDSAFELEGTGSDDETAVFDLEEAEKGLDDGVFDLDDAETEETSTVDADEDELDVSDDVLGEDDELDEMDVFDADEDAFDEGMSPAGQKFASPVGAAAVEHEWGGGIFAGLLVSTVMLVLVGMVMFDLVHTIWAWNEPTPVSSMLLDTLGGLYKK